ncbi:MAG: tyrosine-type recombinase/integrase [Burkholderiales bacterium]
MTARINQVEKRSKLQLRRDPYWQRLTQGRYVGFRRMSAGTTGTWLARYYDGEKYSYSGLGDFALLEEKARYDAAKTAAEAFFARLDMGGTTDKVTVKQACQAYVEHVRQANSEASSLDAKGRFQRLVYSDPLGRVELGKLKRPHVQAWRDRVLAKRPSRGAFNRDAAALKAALNLARERDHIATDHAWRVVLKPFENATKRRTLYLDLAARRKLIEKSPAEVQPLLRTLALLPMRVGEVASLKLEHLNMQTKVLSVPTGKTAPREIPLGDEAFAHLKACAKNKLPSAWLVARADGRQWKKEAWRDMIHDGVKAAKLPRAVCAYTFRHSTVTDLLTAGLDTMTTAKISGTSLAMIQRHYGHLRLEHARDALQGLALA